MRLRSAIAAGALALAATASAELRVCFPQDDPPRAVRAGAQGFDLDVARHLAQSLGEPLKIVWLPVRNQTDIESTDLDFRPLFFGECDLQLSIPGEEVVARFRGRIALSIPYYGAAFEAVPAGTPLRWGEPFDGVVAVRANTVAHVAVNAMGWRWTMRRDAADILGALRGGAATAGLIWGPNLAGTDAARAQGFEPARVLRWNLHAAARRDNAKLAAANEVFATPEFRDRVAALLAAHGIPDRGVFDTVYTADALREVKEG